MHSISMQISLNSSFLLPRGVCKELVPSLQNIFIRSEWDIREKRKLHQKLDNMPWNCISKFSQEILKPYPAHLSTLGKKISQKWGRGGIIKMQKIYPFNNGDRPGPQNFRLHSFKIISFQASCKGLAGTFICKMFSK